MPNTLRFGIESLDRLIGSAQVWEGVNIIKNKWDEVQTTSLCLIGPDGTGKSVLALHLAAQYLADCRTQDQMSPKVLYISTDLTHSMAERIWHNFDLLHPHMRKEPFATRGKRKLLNSLSLELKETLPTDMNKVLAEDKNSVNEVCFVDLSQTTAGDDWAFVHRVLSVLDLPGSPNDPRHLVLLDAVEGFETLVGDLNSFGEKTTRRSRIAQVMRLAANKCHLLFVVEETKQERLPEEFVTDVVIRLRYNEINGYVRRTVEIEKTRGQAHVRGQHPFVTRDGTGSTTGSRQNINYDDPEVSNQNDEPQSYVTIFPSINNLSRSVMEMQGKPRMEAPKGKYAGFGIPYLDTMLSSSGEANSQTTGDLLGLPGSSVTALIGDALTQKSQLGRAFLSRAFYPFAKALADKVKDACPVPEGDYPNQREEYKEKVEAFKGIVNEALGKLKKTALRLDLDGTTKEAYLFSGSKLFHVSDLIKPSALIDKLRDGRDPLTKYLRGKFNPATWRLLKSYKNSRRSTKLLQPLIDDLNEAIMGHLLSDKKRFEHIQLTVKTLRLIAQNPQGDNLIRLNRVLLEEAYPEDIAKSNFSTIDDFLDTKSFVEKLKDKTNSISTYLYKMFRPATRKLLVTHDVLAQPNNELNALLKDNLNELIAGPSLFDPEVFVNVRLSNLTVAELNKPNPTEVDIARLNRLLLEDAYLDELAIEKVSGVAVLMTTQDTHSEELAREFIQWLNAKYLLGIKGDNQDEAVKQFEQVLQTYIQEHTICRRMEIHDLSSPIIAHIFQRNIEAAQRMLFGKCEDDPLPAVKGRFHGSWRIRMVIDDFNAFRNTYPDIHNDPLLLPFLLFHLRREGISTLILDTQSGKPDIALSERFESSLREVADYRLYTWRIPFYGETRIALTAIPPLSPDNRGLIRELRSQWAGSNEDKDERHLTVDPHFELYAGLERGTPHPVPLEVRLYPSTATLIKYIKEENIFFKELFTPHTSKSDVIVGFDPPNYESFREFCYLQRDTRLDYTLVFQIDEFWLTWLTRQSKTRKAGILQRQWQYLNAVTVDENGKPDRAADAYYLFQKTFEQSKQSLPNSSALSRKDFYDNDRLGYGFEDQDKTHDSEIDRVPFLWDFAFLLCRENLWIEYINKDTTDELDQEKKLNVVEVWRDLPKAKPETIEEKNSKTYGKVSWRNFLAACKEVAEYHSAKFSTPVPAFDFSLDAGEAFSCLVLEIWLSEIYDSMKDTDKDIVAGNRNKAAHASYEKVKEDQAPKFAHLLSQKIWNRWEVDDDVSLFKGLIKDEGKSLMDILKEKKEGKETSYSLELYKTWLLLTEVIDFTDLTSSPHSFSFEFKLRQSNPAAVVAHHFYQSACDQIEQKHLAENLVPMRLPGHFSVRGDWFLAVAGGSRSSLLAHRAMDLLSSRRANIKRLQLGIGLPVRNIVEKESDFEFVRTRLMSTDDKTGRLENVSYKELLSIAGRIKHRDEKELRDEFYWLWRSSLYGYARCSRVWQKWLNRMAFWWQTIHSRHKSVWAPGFHIYDNINLYLANKPNAIEEVSKYESWKCFPNMVKILLMELQQVSFGHEHNDEKRSHNR